MNLFIIYGYAESPSEALSTTKSTKRNFKFILFTFVIFVVR